MPGFDGTGPLGGGPRTGGGFGYCGVPGYRGSYGYGYGYGANRGLGRGGRPWGGGRGFGYGGGRRRGGRGRGFAAWGPASGPAYGPASVYSQSAQGDEINFLREQAEWLKHELQNINDRIDTLTRSEAESG